MASTPVAFLHLYAHPRSASPVGSAGLQARPVWDQRRHEAMVQHRRRHYPGPALGVRVVLTHRALEALGPNPRYVSYRVVSS